jgi:hypothetical protein
MFKVELQPTHNKSDGYKTRATMGTFRLPVLQKVKHFISRNKLHFLKFILYNRTLYI